MTAILNKILKINFVLGGGALITISLFYLMQELINVDFKVPPKVISVDSATITEPDLEFVVLERTPLPPKPVEPEDMPELPPPPTVPTGPGSGTGISFNNPVVAPHENTGGDLFMGDANALPIVQVPPTYPNAAIQRGIEGYVIVEFDVNELGQVINARVLYAEPPAIFDKAALKALERWRYKPKIVNNKAVRMLGLQTRLSFNLAE